jgi:hypothetical protein
METYTITYKHNGGVKEIARIEGNHILKVIADFYDTYGYNAKILIIDCE